MSDLDYKNIHRIAKDRAKVVARLHYPAHEKKMIEKKELELTNKYYAQMITPI